MGNKYEDYLHAKLVSAKQLLSLVQSLIVNCKLWDRKK